MSQRIFGPRVEIISFYTSKKRKDARKSINHGRTTSDPKRGVYSIPFSHVNINTIVRD